MVRAAPLMLRWMVNSIGFATLIASIAAAMAMPAAPHAYHPGMAPRAQFKVAGKTYNIDPQAKSAKQIRALPPEHFDPLTRRDRVDQFYRDALKVRFDQRFREDRWHFGRFRPEFIYWVDSWPALWRALWAWHHRIELDEALWLLWMNDPAFAKEIAALEAANTPIDADYMPPQYAQTPPVAIYGDEYINAVYNPTPLLALLQLTSLKSDPATDWIAPATQDSLLSNLASVPGIIVADEHDVDGVVHDQKLQGSDAGETSRAQQIGKRLGVEHVVTGSYVVDGDKVLFNLRIVNVKTANVENGVSETFPRDNLLDRMPSLASSLATMLGYAPPPSLTSTTVGQPLTIEQAAPLTSQTLDQRLADAPSAKRTFAATDTLPGDATFTREDGPYDIQGKLSLAQAVRKVTLHIAAGADVRGGAIVLTNGLHIDAVGTPDHPVIFRHVEFDQPLGGYCKAQYAIFDDCTFHKTGGWFSTGGNSSKWEYDKCIIRGSQPFPKLTHIDYGIKFTDCTFIGAAFPALVVPQPKDKPIDDLGFLRTPWRTIDHCTFESCQIPPTLFWCAVASNYIQCHFTSGPAFESDTPTDVVAYVASTDGDSPDKIALATPAKRAALNIKYVDQPFDVYAFPPPTR